MNILSSGLCLQQRTLNLTLILSFLWGGGRESKEANILLGHCFSPQVLSGKLLS